MNTIEELIQKECPEGVEYLPLSSVCKITSGEFVRKDKQSEYGYPVYNGGTSNTGYYEQYNTQGPKVIISARGAAGFVNYVDGLFWAGNSCHVMNIINDMIDKKYLYHLLKSLEMSIMWQRQDGSIPSVSQKQLYEINVPVPPLSVQHKIVEILDKFTSLEAELQAELEARKKQYEYYRNQLLDFTGREDVEWKTLGEISYYPKERIPSEELNENNYVSVENLLSNKQGKTISSSVPKSGGAIKYIPNDILIGNIRPYLRKIWMADIIGGTNGDVVIVRIKDDFKNSIIPQYLYCLLSSEDFFNYDNSFAKGGKMPRGDKKQILKYPIPIPQLTEQQRIVTILDKFEALINDQTASLAAEMKARHQQYEYYRDKLLTFQRKEA